MPVRVACSKILPRVLSYSLLLSILLVSLPSAMGQTLPNREPLPPFKITFKDSKTMLPGTGGIGNPTRAELSGNVLMIWGDVTLRADHMIYNQVAGTIDASGNIVLVRGDETVRGASLTMNLVTGAFVVEKGVVISPPYYISGEKIERINGVLHAYQGIFALDPEGKGEITIHAREIRFVAGQYTSLSHIGVYLFGSRILTLNGYRIKQQAGSGEGDVPQIPFRVKYTRFSGIAFGFSDTWTLIQKTTLSATAYFPTTNGPQYSLTTTYTLSGTAAASTPLIRRRTRDSIFDATSASDSDTTTPKQSPLRHFLTVRPPSGLDTVLDLHNLLETAESIGRPLDTARRFSTISVTFSDKEELGVKRQGNLLLARRPEIDLVGSLPLLSPVPNHGRPFETNSAVRHYLSSPRFNLTMNATTGEYQETRLTGANPAEGIPNRVEANRQGGVVGIQMLPLLLGSNLLLRSQLQYQFFNYSGGDEYRSAEIGISTAYIFDRYTLLGASLYQRAPSGQTPFFFDQIDTRSEAQATLQGRLSQTITAAGLIRYDLDQGKIFDWGYIIGMRGRSIEPRLSYRHLGNEYSLGFSLVGL